MDYRNKLILAPMVGVAEKDRAEATKKAATSERELLQRELDSTRDQEMKMKADVKVLVKEVKSLRKSQTELKQELQQSLKAKSEVEYYNDQLLGGRRISLGTC